MGLYLRLYLQLFVLLMSSYSMYTQTVFSRNDPLCSCVEIALNGDGSPEKVLGVYGYDEIKNCLFKKACEAHCRKRGERWIKNGGLYEFYDGHTAGSEYCKKFGNVMNKHVGIFYKLCDKRYPTGIITKHRLCCINRVQKNCSAIKST